MLYLLNSQNSQVHRKRHNTLVVRKLLHSTIHISLREFHTDLGSKPFVQRIAAPRRLVLDYFLQIFECGLKF